MAGDNASTHAAAAARAVRREWEWDNPRCPRCEEHHPPDQCAPVDLRAASLWQPYASLIALGLKRIETRGWATSYRGPLLIHAAKRLVGRRGDRWTLGDVEIERDAAGYLLRGPALSWPYRLPLGAAVARANLVDCVPTEDIVFYGNTIDLLGAPWVQVPADGPDEPAYVEVDASERPYGDFGPGRFAWLLADVEPIRNPIPMTGRQGLWKPDPALLDDRTETT